MTAIIKQKSPLRQIAWETLNLILLAACLLLITIGQWCNFTILQDLECPYAVLHIQCFDCLYYPITNYALDRWEQTTYRLTNIHCNLQTELAQADSVKILLCIVGKLGCQDSLNLMKWHQDVSKFVYRQAYKILCKL